MRCPYCGHHDLKVVDSRDSEVGEAIRRRRECLQCGQRFTTYERIEAVPFYVTKKDGRREDFDPQKLFTGLKKATEKRDISPERLRAIVDDIEAELRRSGRVEIPSGEIGEMVMVRLRDLDEVAYIRFASVYREFMDLQDVKREIEQVLSSRAGARATTRRPATRPTAHSTPPETGRGGAPPRFGGRKPPAESLSPPDAADLEQLEELRARGSRLEL